MKLSTSIWAFVLLVLFLMGCAKKPIYICGTGALMSRPSIESKVLSLRTIGIADTITAFVTGTIFGKDSIDKKVTIDTLSFATITLINNERHDTIKVVSDAQGKFQKHFQAGTYDILVKCVAYTGLIIKNVPFGRGELKEFTALLGQQGQTIVDSKVDANKVNCSSYFDNTLGKLVYTLTDKMPEYEKGGTDILSFFSKNFVYPKEQEDNFQGLIYISFIVDTDGRLQNIDVDKKYFGDKYSAVDLEAIRVFKLMPAWTPGQCNGSTVPVKMIIPIRF